MRRFPVKPFQSADCQEKRVGTVLLQGLLRCSVKECYRSLKLPVGNRRCDLPLAQGFLDGNGGVLDVSGGFEGYPLVDVLSAPSVGFPAEGHLPVSQYFAQGSRRLSKHKREHPLGLPEADEIVLNRYVKQFPFPLIPFTVSSADRLFRRTGDVIIRFPHSVDEGSGRHGIYGPS